MDENQNYGYKDGSFGNQNQRMNDGQQPYVKQSYGQNEETFAQAPYGQNEQPFVQAPYGQNEQPFAQAPYGQNEQPFVQGYYGQQPASTGPQFNQMPYGAQQYNQQNFGQPMNMAVYDAVPERIHGTSIAALVCGILGLIFFWIPGVDLGLCLAGVICSIVSLIKGFGGKGIAVAGLILSILASILTLIFFYFFVLGLMLL